MATKSMEKSGKSATKTRRKSAQAKAKTKRTRKTQTEPKTKKGAVSRSSPRSSSSGKKKTPTPQSSGINSITELKKQQSEKNRHTAEKSFIATRSASEITLASARRKPTARGYNKYFKLVTDPSVKTVAEDSTSAATYAQKPTVQTSEEDKNQQNLKFAPLSAAKQEPVIPAPRKIRKKTGDSKAEPENETFVSSDTQPESRTVGEEQEIIKRILGEKTADKTSQNQDDREEARNDSASEAEKTVTNATPIASEDRTQDETETETVEQAKAEDEAQSLTVAPEDKAGLTASELEASLTKELEDSAAKELDEDTEDSEKDESAVSTIAKWLLKLVKPSEVKTEPARIIRADDDPEVKTESEPDEESIPEPENKSAPELETKPEAKEPKTKEPKTDQTDAGVKSKQPPVKADKSETDQPVLIRQSKSIKREHSDEVKSWQPSRIEVSETTDYHGLDQETYDNLTNARTGKPAVEKKVVASKLLDSERQARMEKNRIKSFNPEKVEASEHEETPAKTDLVQPDVSKTKTEKATSLTDSQEIEQKTEAGKQNSEPEQESVFVSSNEGKPARETLGEGDLDEDDFNTDIQRVRVKRKIPDLIARLYRDFDRERHQDEEPEIETKPASKAKTADEEAKASETKKQTKSQSRIDKPSARPSRASSKRSGKDAIPDVISRFYREMLPEGAQLTEIPEDEPWGPSEPKVPLKAFDDEPGKATRKDNKQKQVKSSPEKHGHKTQPEKTVARKQAEAPKEALQSKAVTESKPVVKSETSKTETAKPKQHRQTAVSGEVKRKPEPQRAETADADLKQRIIDSRPTFKLDKTDSAVREKESIDKLEKILAEENTDKSDHSTQEITEQVGTDPVEDSDQIEPQDDIPEDAVDLVMMTAEQEVIEEDPDDTQKLNETSDLHSDEEDDDDDDEIEELLVRAQKEAELEQNSGMEIEQKAELERLNNQTEKLKKSESEFEETGLESEQFSADGMVDQLKDDLVIPDDEEFEKIPDSEPDYYEVKSNKLVKPWSLDVEIALRDLVGNIDNLDESSLDEVIYDWKKAYNEYFDQVVSSSRFPYIWLDSCLDKSHPTGKIKHYLAVIGANATGQRKLLALTEGDPTSGEDWKKTLMDLEKRGLANPRLFVGAPDLAAWSELARIFPRAEKQYCWNNIKRRVLRRITASKKNAASKLLDLISQAQSKHEALELIDRFRGIYGRENSVAVGNLLKYKEGLLRYFDFPQKHWNDITISRHLSTVFPSGELLATIYKYDRFYEESLYPIFIHLNRTQSKWPRLKAMGKLRQLLDGKKFVDGKPASGKKVAPVSQKPKKQKSKSILDTISDKASNLISKLAQSETEDSSAKTEKTSEKRKLILKSPEKLLGQDKTKQELKPEAQEQSAATSTDQVSSEDMARFLLDLHKKRSEGAVQPRLRLDKLAQLAEENKKKKAVSGLEKEFLKELNKRKMSVKQ